MQMLPAPAGAALLLFSCKQSALGRVNPPQLSFSVGNLTVGENREAPLTSPPWGGKEEVGRRLPHLPCSLLPLHWHQHKQSKKKLCVCACLNLWEKNSPACTATKTEELCHHICWKEAEVTHTPPPVKQMLCGVKQPQQPHWLCWVACSRRTVPLNLHYLPAAACWWWWWQPTTANCVHRRWYSGCWPNHCLPSFLAHTIIFACSLSSSPPQVETTASWDRVVKEWSRTSTMP